MELYYALWILTVFLWIKETFLWYIRSMKKFLWIKESFVNSKKISSIQRNRFVYIKENVFESTKLSFIQRNFFFDCIYQRNVWINKTFFNSKKLFSQCTTFWIWVKIFDNFNHLKVIDYSNLKNLKSFCGKKEAAECRQSQKFRTELNNWLLVRND